MKRSIIAWIVFALLVVGLVGPSPVPMAQNPEPDNPAPTTPGSGMPGWPIPAQPIPHHEPGQPARSGQARYQVTRLNAEGEEEMVELRGLDALLADGTITDPLQGNYRLVGLDKFMFSSYDFDADAIGNDPVSSAKVESRSATACSPNADQVALYVDYDYGGQCVRKDIGQYPNPGSIGLPNDSISSVEVGSNAVAVLCRDDNYGGGCETFTGDDPNLGNNSIGNDAVSSVKVEPVPNSFSVASFEMEATGILDKVPNSNVDVGNFRFTEIAAGDLNGDLVDEQIVASAHPTITLRISELPGSFGQATSAPGVIAHPDGSLDLVVRGYDQALWHRHYDGAAWGDWVNDAGGVLLSAPAVASTASGELDAFAVMRKDNQVYHTQWVSPTWTSWALVDGGGIFTDTLGSGPIPDVPAPAVVARGGGLDLFRLGPDNTLWWRDSGGTWENLGGMLASGPGAISLGGGMQVYALGLDGTLWYRTYAGGWGDWARLETPDGVAPHAVPVLASPATNQVRVYLAGTENRIWQTQSATWGTWTPVDPQVGDRSTAGYSGQGLGLDGIDDYVDLPDGFPYVTSFTFAAWVYWRGGDPYQRIFDFGRDTDYYMDLRAINYEGKPEFTITTGSWPDHEILTAPGALTPGAWVHVAVTLDDTTDTGVLYINGSPVDTGDITLTPQDVVGQNTWLGRSQYATDPAFNGKLDEVAVFDRALSASEIAAIHAGGWDDGDADLQMGLHLEEAPALHGTTLVDASGQGNDGTLYTQEPVAGLGAARSHLLAQTRDGSLHSLEASEWVRLAGLDVAQSFETGAVTRPLYADSAIENIILDISTGYFTGDGRQQVVLAYETADNKLRLEVYDMQAGFGLTKTAELAVPIAGRWPRVAAGDVDGDGVDEIGLAYTPDDLHYQVKVYQIEKDNGEWTGNLIKIGESDPMGASDGEGPLYRAGTLRIESGNVEPDPATPNDEFVVLADFQGGWRRLEAQLYVYDHENVPSDPMATRHVKATDQIYWAHTDVTGLGLAVGNVDGIGLEEIVVTWPRDFSYDDWPNLERELVVCRYVDGSWTCPDTYQMPHFSPLSFLETLAVGDLDQDLQDEIVLATATYQPATGQVDYALELYEFETLSSGPEHEYPLYFATIPRAFNLAMGDFTGDSLRVGPPTYRLQNRVDSLVAIINMPPKHRDYVKVDDGGGSYHYELLEVMVDSSTFAEHGTATGGSSSTETKNQRDWAIGAGLDAKAEGFGKSVDLSLEYSYGENFETSQGVITEYSFTQYATAESHDRIVYFGTPYKVWEYPLYALGTPEPIDYISVIWPVPDNAGKTREPDMTTGDYAAEPWYRARHQTYNVWSYDPVGAVSFPDFDPNQVIIDPSNEGGDAGYSFSESTTGEFYTSTTKTHDFSAELGFGAKGGFFGGLVKYNVRVHVKGSYKQADIETEKQTATTATDISLHLGTQDRQFRTKVIGYWAQGGYLVLDYQTDMTSAEWNIYADPDPAFILPWAGFPYGDDPVDPTSGLERFSPEVQVVPQSASVGETVTISATVRNFSNEVADDVKVRFCQGDPGPRCEPPDGEAYIDEVTIAELDRQDGPKTVAIDWQASGTGKQRIYAVLDPDNTIDPEVHDEDDLINNNVAYGLVTIGGAAIVDHGLASELPYQHFSYDQGNAWIVAGYVPPGNLSEVVHFELRDAGLSVSNAVAKPFELVGYAGEEFREKKQRLDYDFYLKDPATTDPPAVIGLAQSQVNVVDLTLYRATDESGSSWEVATCSGYQTQQFAGENLIYVPISQTGIFVFAESTPEPTLEPVAQFSAAPTSGASPLTVAFTDQSSNYPTGWLWAFGDGGTSGEQHPEHLYTAAGTFTVTLTVSNTAGLHTLTKPSYITAVKADHKIYLPLVLRNAP